MRPFPTLQRAGEAVASQQQQTGDASSDPSNRSRTTAALGLLSKFAKGGAAASLLASSSGSASASGASSAVPFAFEPNEVTFPGYVHGQEYVRTIIAKNITSKACKIMVVPPRTSLFSVEVIAPHSGGGIIAPGLTVSLTIRFRAPVPDVLLQQQQKQQQLQQHHQSQHHHHPFFDDDDHSSTKNGGRFHRQQQQQLSLLPLAKQFVKPQAFHDVIAVVSGDEYTHRSEIFLHAYPMGCDIQVLQDLSAGGGVGEAARTELKTCSSPPRGGGGSGGSGGGIVAPLAPSVFSPLSKANIGVLHDYETTALGGSDLGATSSKMGLVSFGVVVARTRVVRRITLANRGGMPGRFRVLFEPLPSSSSLAGGGGGAGGGAQSQQAGMIAVKCLSATPSAGVLAPFGQPGSTVEVR